MSITLDSVVKLLESEFVGETPGRKEELLRIVLNMPRKYPPPRQQHGRLLLDVGAFCQGCGRDYNFDPRVLEVDHIRPKADGGSDAYDNLTLLCPPCNRIKQHRMTLSGLQAQNRREGHLLSKNEQNLRIRSRSTLKTQTAEVRTWKH